MATWFTVRLADRPGSLARLASTLADRGINITGIVGVAEDTDGALMLTTSDEAGTRAALGVAGVAFEEHDAVSGGSAPGFAGVRDGLAHHGIDVGER
ncbi:MAG TPA: ACT domain-containing protein [Candidatus Acidoferrales bacterium]|nr:ACT domain-containing protein [Candidatus Acidoferrales bacterium]